MQQAIESFFYGVTLPWRAFLLITRRPRLMLWSVFPIGITLALYGWLIVSLQEGARAHILHLFAAHGWSPTGWSAWLLLVLMRVVLIVLGAATFSFVGTIAASPFNDLLAESTERWALPQLPPVPHPTVPRRIRLIGIDAAKTIISTTALLAAVILSWLPGVNLIAWAAEALLMTFQYTSYPQTRRGQGLGAGLTFLIRHFFACLGFGWVLTLLFSIPFLASLVLPLAVVGGTLLVARAQERGLR